MLRKMEAHQFFSQRKCQDIVLRAYAPVVCGCIGGGGAAWCATVVCGCIHPGGGGAAWCATVVCGCIHPGGGGAAWCAT
jgi:hypothetical protein